MSVSGLVLAAGAARRFGTVKQLASLGGRPLLQYAVDVACEAPELDEVVVVLGARADDIREALPPGHPVALYSTVAARVGELRGDEGARSLLHGAVTLEVDCSALGAPHDVDTPHDLAGLAHRTKADSITQIR